MRIEKQKEYYKQYYIDNKERIKQYRVNNKDRFKENRKQYLIDNKEKIKDYYNTFDSRCKHWKHTAKRRNIEWNLTVQDLKSMPKICHYSGRPLTCLSNQYDTISLDRLDSSKGYIKGNVVFCCGFINVMKSNLTYDQFIFACKMIVNHSHKNETVNS